MTFTGIRRLSIMIITEIRKTTLSREGVRIGKDGDEGACDSGWFPACWSKSR